MKQKNIKCSACGFPEKDLNWVKEKAVSYSTLDGCTIGERICPKCFALNKTKNIKCSTCGFYLGKESNWEFETAGSYGTLTVGLRRCPKCFADNEAESSICSSSGFSEKNLNGAIEKAVDLFETSSKLTKFVIGGTTLALSTLGFGAGGVAAGSIAAGIQSTYGGTIAAGSLFSMLQSVGAAGLGTSTKVAIGAACTAVAAIAKKKTSKN